VRYHDLRHGWATAALRAGVNAKVVADVLGHSSVSFTLDRYSHSIPALEQEATTKVAELIFG
jgi:integrase